MGNESVKLTAALKEFIYLWKIGTKFIAFNVTHCAKNLLIMFIKTIKQLLRSISYSARILYEIILLLPFQPDIMYYILSFVVRILSYVGTIYVRHENSISLNFNSRLLPPFHKILFIKLHLLFCCGFSFFRSKIDSKIHLLMNFTNYKFIENPANMM